MHPDKKMSWGCFSVTGPGALEPNEGTMNSRIYWQIIEGRVCREMANFHFQAIFQQDSAPCHVAKIISKRNRSAGMAWQLTRSQFYRKPVVHHEKSLQETGLHYKNEANSVLHTHMVSQ